MKINLGRGFFTLVDEIDFGYLTQFNWHIQLCRGKIYAARTCNLTRRTILMHRELLNAPELSKVDHRDNDGLNNSRSNLRYTSISFNQANSPKRNVINGRHSSSAFKGVNIKGNKFIAQIQANGKKQHLGCFESEIEAAKAYDKKAFQLFGEFARLNFPINLAQ